MGMLKEADVESRSSASSDIDSESDVSFDDSASDRSDGSDSGHYANEPLTAARAIALSRVQHQQRSRLMMTSLQHSSQGNTGDSEQQYQSGDSIDSTRAEDSAGSDSSSTSDMAD
jgi:hypothetical protein